MMNVSLNKTYGGYSLSKTAIKLCKDRGLANICYSNVECFREDPIVIQVIKELGKNANDECSKLCIVTIPTIYKDIYSIEEYDGWETINLNHSNYQLIEIQKIVSDDEDNKIERIQSVLSLVEPEVKNVM